MHFLTHFREEDRESFSRFHHTLFSGIIDTEASFGDGLRHRPEGLSAFAMSLFLATGSHLTIGR